MGFKMHEILMQEFQHEYNKEFKNDRIQYHFRGVWKRNISRDLTILSTSSEYNLFT